VRSLLAGVPFHVVPEDRIDQEERSALLRIERAPRVAGGRWEPLCEPFTISLATPSGEPGPPAGVSGGGPASVSTAGDLVRIEADRFRAEVRPFEGRATLLRPLGRPFCLEATMRVALCCRLPLIGGLPLHAAGSVLEKGGVVFHGVSGAGKSTISASSPCPVLSDEAVAVVPRGEGFELSSSGFWRTLGSGAAPAGFVPLRAIFDLHKGTETRIERLSRREALLALLPVITIPDQPRLWAAALKAAGHLVRSVPSYRLAWTPERPPWDEIRALLDAAA
jgi:hypothetical protein